MTRIVQDSHFKYFGVTGNIDFNEIYKELSGICLIRATANELKIQALKTPPSG